VARARDSNESKALSNITPRSTPDPIGETIWNYLEPSTSIRYPAVKGARSHVCRSPSFLSSPHTCYVISASREEPGEGQNLRASVRRLHARSRWREKGDAAHAPC